MIEQNDDIKIIFLYCKSVHNLGGPFNVSQAKNCLLMLIHVSFLTSL
jgi:hypothetical protein